MAVKKKKAAPAKAPKAAKGLEPDSGLKPMTDAAKKELAKRMPPEVADAIASLGAGSYGKGFLQVFAPKELDKTLARWLGGTIDLTRTPFARTALGDVLYVRDLRKRARDLQLEPSVAKSAHDVTILDVRYKRTRVLATNAKDFLERLKDPFWLKHQLRKDLFDAAYRRLGAPKRDEIYSFVPALALGGSEDPKSLARNKADVAIDILLQC